MTQFSMNSRKFVVQWVLRSREVPDSDFDTETGRRFSVIFFGPSKQYRDICTIMSRSLLPTSFLIYYAPMNPLFACTLI